MIIKNIKNLNITALFSQPLDHQLVSVESILGALNMPTTNTDVRANSAQVEAPGLKVVLIPGIKKEFIFENVRLQVNDKSENSVVESSLISDFYDLVKKGIIDDSKIVAHGFNFDLLVEPNEGFKIQDLISEKIASLPNVTTAGINIGFGKDDQKLSFDLKPIGNGSQYLAHLNIHMSSSLLSENEMKESFKSGFQDFEKIIKEIK